MSQELYESLLNGDTETQKSEEAQWLARLSTALREELHWRKNSLAQAEFEEGLYHNEEDAWALSRAEVTALAADDQPALTFPTHYHGGPWRIILKRQQDGTPALRIDLGESNAEVLIEEEWIHAELGVELPLPQLSEPPLQLHLRILGGGSWLLWPR